MQEPSKNKSAIRAFHPEAVRSSETSVLSTGLQGVISEIRLLFVLRFVVILLLLVVFSYNKTGSQPKSK
jgi:hypothetical protein